MNQASDETLVSEVLAAEERRIRALVDADWVTLEEILDDRLTYTHLSGRIENKEIYFSGAKNRRHAVERSGLSVRIFGDVAVMTGAIAFSTPGDLDGSSRLEGIALQVWAKREGVWRLVALQATRTGPPPA